MLERLRGAARWSRGAPRRLGCFLIEDRTVSWTMRILTVGNIVVFAFMLSLLQDAADLRADAYRILSDVRDLRESWENRESPPVTVCDYYPGQTEARTTEEAVGMYMRGELDCD